MSGKITTVLTKREAESYRAQGLHQEAIDLFARLLDTCPNIDPDIQTSIRAQIDGLSMEKESVTGRRAEPLSAEEIARIRQGWGEQAGAAEVLVCAKAFSQIGAHREALVEYGQLLRSGGDPKSLVEPIAECLVAGHTPNDLPAAVEKLCAEAFDQSPNALGFQVHLAKCMARETAHAVVYFEYLLGKEGLPETVMDRLSAALAKLSSNSDSAEPPPADHPTAPPETQQNRSSKSPWRTLIGRLIGRKPA